MRNLTATLAVFVLAAIIGVDASGNPIYASGYYYGYHGRHYYPRQSYSYSWSYPQYYGYRSYHYDYGYYPRRERHHYRSHYYRRHHDWRW